jgi:hypothetical protein
LDDGLLLHLKDPEYRRDFGQDLGCALTALLPLYFLLTANSVSLDALLGLARPPIAARRQR